MSEPSSARSPAPSWTPWRTILAFGLVSLAADMVYEGMRSVAGPFLGSPPAALAGGTAAGGLYEHHADLLIALVAVSQVAALGLLVAALRGRKSGARG